MKTSSNGGWAKVRDYLQQVRDTLERKKIEKMMVAGLPPPTPEAAWTGDEDEVQNPMDTYMSPFSSVSSSSQTYTFSSTGSAGTLTMPLSSAQQYVGGNIYPGFQPVPVPPAQMPPLQPYDPNPGFVLGALTEAVLKAIVQGVVDELLERGLVAVKAPVTDDDVNDYPQ